MTDHAHVPQDMAMRSPIRSRVERATVTFLKHGGRGVLVAGNLIVTAAHVLPWTSEGWMAVGDSPKYIEPIQTHNRRELRIYPLAIEPVVDVAVLGAVDGQWIPDDCEAFEAFCAETRPVLLDTTDPMIQTPQPAHIFGHTGWNTAQVTLSRVDAPSYTISATAPILGGTSGSPVVTSKGRLLGVMSSAWGTAPRGTPVNDDEMRDGSVGRVHLAAPVWCVQEMMWSYARKHARARRAFDQYRRAHPERRLNLPDGIS